MCFAHRQLWSEFSSSNSRNEEAPWVDQLFWFPSCDWHSGEGLMLPAVLVVIAPSCLFKPDPWEPKIWGWTWWGWTWWMGGGMEGRGTFGARGRPPERPWFLLVPVSPVYSLFQPDQGFKRESRGWVVVVVVGGVVFDLQVTQQLLWMDENGIWSCGWESGLETLCGSPVKL